MTQEKVLSAMRPRVFGIGLSRTGTTTLHTLLEQLGYKSLHYCYSSLLEPCWADLGGFDALLDSPIPMIYRQCDRMYPGSRFILTRRDKEAWLRSMHWLFTHGKVLWDWDKRTHAYHSEFYGTRRFSRSVFSAHWDAYHEQVDAYFSERPEDLLIIDLETGFDVESICDFLDIERQSVTVEKVNARRNCSLGARLRYFLRHL